MKMWALTFNRKWEEAYTEFNKISEISKSSYMIRAGLLRLYAHQKKHTEAIQLIDDKFILWAKKDFQYSLFLAEAYAMLNDKEEALNWLENSINRRWPFPDSRPSWRTGRRASVCATC
jgi:tetratricopeptide (TPR) repeat protein